jgi:tRNA (mo5U34)-methyltransferase
MSMPTQPVVVPDFLQHVRWHHSIELPNGRVIKGDKSIERMKQQYDLTFGPFDLNGKSVLDLGTWNGAFAVEAARRGAARVLGIDYITWRPPYTYGREAFDFIVAASGYKVDGVEIDIDASPLSLGYLGSFDIVLFLGVFYHLRDPIAAIREISKITREALVIETYWASDIPANPPAMVFYPGRELANDPTNWWAPNISCVEALLKTFGFARVIVTNGSIPNRKMFYAYKTPID